MAQKPDTLSDQDIKDIFKGDDFWKEETPTNITNRLSVIDDLSKKNLQVGDIIPLANNNVQIMEINDVDIQYLDENVHIFEKLNNIVTSEEDVPIEVLAENSHSQSDHDNLEESEIEERNDSAITAENKNTLSDNLNNFQIILNTAQVDLDSQEARENEAVNNIKKTRKKKQSGYKWKQNIAKARYQAGEEYISKRKKNVPKKEVKTIKDCKTTCKFKCARYISEKERHETFKSFYGLDQNGKYDFIARTTKRLLKNRSTTKDNSSRRTYTFKYMFFINNQQIEVCKTFYLTSLNISQKPIYNVHLKKDKVTGVPQRDKRGKGGNHNRISEEQINTVKDHINSFPSIESHYCRYRTAKRYIDANLNITKMYDLYVIKCEEESRDPVKASFYRYVFCTNFNIDFHIPKSDRCGYCEIYKNIKKEEPDKEITEEYKKHLNEKKNMREQKKADKDSGTPVLIFDMENVITCPRTEIGPLFYKCKLNIYNLTAYLTTTKTTYCAIWTEKTAGRTGNDIASALIRILERVFEENDITNLITWSDSCVPQNRNSVMSFAISDFMQRHPHIESITMKFSIAGHSACQEVDNAHSAIERHLKINEFFSPIALIRLLKSVNRKKPFIIMQMRQADYKNYHDLSKKLEYKNIPFSKVQILRFTQSRFHVEFSLGFSTEFKEVSIAPAEKKLSRRPEVPSNDLNKLSQNDLVCRTIQPRKGETGIKAEKKDHLISMFIYMSQQDIEYYKVCLDISKLQF